MTEKRSIKSVVRESVGLADETAAPSPTARGPGGTMPLPGTLPGGQLRGLTVREAVRGRAAQPTPKAAVQRSDADAMAAAILRSFDAIAQRLDVIGRKLDAQPVTRAAYVPPPDPGYGVPNFGQQLPLPPTGGPNVNNVRTPVLRAMIQRSLGHRL